MKTLIILAVMYGMIGIVLSIGYVIYNICTHGLGD